jgi:hypothetical protein
MTLGIHKTNCTLNAPGYGEYKLVVTGLGYGKSVVSSESEARRFKTFYPQIATSGEWFVMPVFRSYGEKNAFNWWMAAYFNQLVDPNTSPLMPMTVSVNSRNFRKVGYPKSSVDFGDEFAKVLYSMKVSFVSATDPNLSRSDVSRYIPALRDSAVSQRFFPGGIQTGQAPSYASGWIDGPVRNVQEGRR